jgi:hypothetical protein
MTNSQVDGTRLVVVDGSNIATEGRSVPSLAQLNDAVLALTSEFSDITVTVVVDATFGHRIDKSEVAEFDEAVAHNELVTPPAGAIGRGDAFVLSIANKVGARIFSNDSFQEFHGVYPWLFDEGRLIGGKPVPHVGWVFVNRVPVKGPVSRKARSGNRDGVGSRRAVSKLANLPMPIPTSPPPGRAAAKSATAALAAAEPATSGGRGRRRRSETIAAEPVPATGKDATPPTPAAAPPSGGPVNDLLPFLDFVEHHPVGTGVTGIVETYSSHGAYVKVGDVRGYVPLRLMGTPPPRSAREVMRLGDSVPLVVASFAPPRRSIDLAVPGIVDVAPPIEDPTPKRRGRKATALPESEAASEATTAEAPPTEPAEPKRRRRGKSAEQPAPDEIVAAGVVPATEPVAEAEPAARSGRRSKAAAEPTTPEPPAPKGTRQRRSAEAEPAASATPRTKKTAATKKSAPAKKVAAKKSSAVRTAAPATTSGDESTSSASPAKKSRAAKAASPAARGGAGETPKRGATKKAAAPKPETGTVDGGGTASEPAPRRRRSRSSAGD